MILIIKILIIFFFKYVFINIPKYSVAIPKEALKVKQWLNHTVCIKLCVLPWTFKSSRVNCLQYLFAPEHCAVATQVDRASLPFSFSRGHLPFPLPPPSPQPSLCLSPPQQASSQAGLPTSPALRPNQPPPSHDAVPSPLLRPTDRTHDAGYGHTWPFLTASDTPWQNKSPISHTSTWLVVPAWGKGALATIW